MRIVSCCTHKISENNKETKHNEFINDVYCMTNCIHVSKHIRTIIFFNFILRFSSSSYPLFFIFFDFMVKKKLEVFFCWGSNSYHAQRCMVCGYFGLTHRLPVFQTSFIVISTQKWESSYSASNMVGVLGRQLIRTFHEICLFQGIDRRR